MFYFLFIIKQVHLFNEIYQATDKYHFSLKRKKKSRNMTATEALVDLTQLHELGAGEKVLEKLFIRIRRDRASSEKLMEAADKSQRCSLNMQGNLVFVFFKTFLKNIFTVFIALSIISKQLAGKIEPGNKEEKLTSCQVSSTTYILYQPLN